MRFRTKLAAWLAGASLMMTTTSPSWASPRRQGVGTAKSALTIVLRPETDASRRVIGMVIEERIVLAGPPRRLSLTAPVRFAGMVPVGSVVSDFTVADAGGRVSTSTSEVATAGGPTRRWTSDRELSGDVIVHYRLPLTPFAQRGPPYGMKAAGLGVAGNSGSLLVLPSLTVCTDRRCAGICRA